MRAQVGWKILCETGQNAGNLIGLSLPFTEFLWIIIITLFPFLCTSFFSQTKRRCIRQMYLEWVTEGINQMRNDAIVTNPFLMSYGRNPNFWADIHQSQFLDDDINSRVYVHRVYVLMWSTFILFIFCWESAPMIAFKQDEYETVGKMRIIISN